jgi:ankyrin repeat protein
LEVVQALLAAKADPDPKATVGGRTALMAAISQGHLDVARTLMSAGANPGSAASSGETPLMLAAGSKAPGNLALVQAILAAHVDVDAGRLPVRMESQGRSLRIAVPSGPDPLGVSPTLRSGVGTALGRAASAGNVQIVQALLAANARVDARQNGFSTPLIDAAAGGHVDVMRVLLGAWADVEAKDNAGHTALMRAAANKHVDAVKALIAAKADVNARRRDGGTALMMTMQLDQAEARGIQASKVVAALSPGSAEPGRASLTDRAEVVTLLLSAGADANAVESNGNSALMLASAHGHPDVVRLLLAAQADVNATRRDGNSALSLAIQNEHAEVAELLKGAGAGRQ